MLRNGRSKDSFKQDTESQDLLYGLQHSSEAADSGTTNPVVSAHH